jgi:hypothetical protein
MFPITEIPSKLGIDLIVKGLSLSKLSLALLTLLLAPASCLKPISVDAKEITFMPTTSQIFGLTPQEKAAAVFTAAGEAGPGKDALGVLQTILTRKFKSGGNIANLVKAPQQFVANDRYSLQQVTNPEYGQKVHGSRYRQIEQMMEDPMQMAQGFQSGQGATQFRGQALLGNKQKGDIMFDPKGNFYFQTNPGLAKTLSERLKKGAGTTGEPQAQAPTQAQAVPTQSQPGGNTYIILGAEGKPEPADFLSGYVNQLLNPKTQIKSSIDPTAMLMAAVNQTPNYFGSEA